MEHLGVIKRTPSKYLKGVAVICEVVLKSLSPKGVNEAGTMRRVPKQITLGWLRKKGVDQKFTNGELLLDVRRELISKVSANILEEWLLEEAVLSYDKNIKRNYDWLGNLPTAALGRVPWNKFRPERWARHVGRLKEIQVYRKEPQFCAFISRVEGFQRLKANPSISIS